VTRLTFATYLHPELDRLSRPADQITFVGQSYPYWRQVRMRLAEVLREYPALPLRTATLTDFERVHTPGYLRALVDMAAGQPPEQLPRLSIECRGMEHCLPAYQYGLGGMCAALDEMRRGALDRAYCFSLGGHHAHADWGHGYCVLHPLAAAVRYAQVQGFGRVLIVDWDIHHGDGTQAIFAHDPSVCCISLHSAADLYMAAAGDLRVGTTTAAEAVGHCNIPILHRGYDPAQLTELGLEGRLYRAEESLPALREALERLPWAPDLVCIFSGYDGHRDDGGRNITNWTDEDFAALTETVLELAGRAGSPVLSVHGGGYTLDVAVSAAARHVETLATRALQKGRP
jgi:acetoin utilization deacetylase AcuC-like enzyme